MKIQRRITDTLTIELDLSGHALEFALQDGYSPQEPQTQEFKTMKQEQERLEAMGYSFKTEKQSTIEPDNRRPQTFYTVTVFFGGVQIGNRADKNEARAMFGAVKLAKENEVQNGQM